MGIYADNLDFPEVNPQHTIWHKETISTVAESYAKEVQEGYVLVNGEKVYQLPEVEVNALLLPDSWVSYNVIEPERIQQVKGKTALDLLKQLPGVMIRATTYFNESRLVALIPNRNMNVRGDNKKMPFENWVNNRSWKIVPVLIDGKRLDNIENLDDIDIREVKSVDFVRDRKVTFANSEMDWEEWETYGEEYLSVGYAIDPKNPNPLVVQPQRIYITTFLYNGFVPMDAPSVSRVGYLSYAENATFYAPKYPTEKSREIIDSDNRTTIHWEPNLRLNENGETVISFYTADLPSTYTAVIEGITTDGKVCRFVKRIK